MSRNELDWLIGHRLKEAVRHEYTWDFVLEGAAVISTECLWRLVELGRIQLTSRDDGHRFGLLDTLDATLQLNQALAGARTKSITLKEGTLDVEVTFETGHVLQIIPESSGYEAWNARKPGWTCIAVGGGELTIFRDGK